MPTISADVVVDGSHVYRPGWIRWEGRTIHSCGPGIRGEYYSESVIAPGFIDIHSHGGGGVSYGDAQCHLAVHYHRLHGCTGGLASLVTNSLSDLLDQISRLVELSHMKMIDGIHLEGPWLNPHYCGAHDKNLFHPPSEEELDQILQVGQGTIRMITLAPELPGSLEIIQRCTQEGITVALGHTEATYHRTCWAIEAGARVGTHVFNAMAPIHHRHPGPIPALLADNRVTLELIGDDIHLNRDFLRAIISCVGAHRIALVTDCLLTSGAPPGNYRLGKYDLEIRDGATYLYGTSTLAGSMATMDQFFSSLARYSDDHSLLAATRMCSSTPARAIGLAQCGYLRKDYRANCVLLNADLLLQRVLYDGQWI